MSDQTWGHCTGSVNMSTCGPAVRSTRVGVAATTEGVAGSVEGLLGSTLTTALVRDFQGKAKYRLQFIEDISVRKLAERQGEKELVGRRRWGRKRGVR